MESLREILHLASNILGILKFSTAPSNFKHDSSVDRQVVNTVEIPLVILEISS